MPPDRDGGFSHGGFLSTPSRTLERTALGTRLWARAGGHLLQLRGPICKQRALGSLLHKAWSRACCSPGNSYVYLKMLPGSRAGGGSRTCLRRTPQASLKEPQILAEAWLQF